MVQVIFARFMWACRPSPTGQAVDAPGAGHHGGRQRQVVGLQGRHAAGLVGHDELDRRRRLRGSNRAALTFGQTP